MRYITADYIFPISSPPVQRGVIAINENGVIEDVITTPYSDLPVPPESFKGIICPGFINAHCHLELSHLKGKMSEGKGLPQFIKEIIPNRNAAPEVIEQAIVAAEEEMIARGIAGAGDICNTNHTFAQKAKGNIRYHNFIELFDLDAARAEEEFKKGMLLAEELKLLPSPYSIVPHAPYSVSPKLLQLIKAYAEKNNSIISIHNQETASENEMFLSATGDLFELLKPFISASEEWKARGLRSPEAIADNLHTGNKLLLVHNTYTSAEDIALLISNLVYWCFCPNANLFIENRLPDFKAFIAAGAKAVIGTDSYASNWSLSILDELKTIQKYNPSIPLLDLLQWATLNGAEFFGWDKELGSIEKGKKPGLNLIEHVDLQALQLTTASKVRKIT